MAAALDNLVPEENLAVRQARRWMLGGILSVGLIASLAWSHRDTAALCPPVTPRQLGRTTAFLWARRLLQRVQAGIHEGLAHMRDVKKGRRDRPPPPPEG